MNEKPRRGGAFLFTNLLLLLAALPRLLVLLAGVLATLLAALSTLLATALLAALTTLLAALVLLVHIVFLFDWLDSIQYGEMLIRSWYRLAQCPPSLRMRRCGATPRCKERFLTGYVRLSIHCNEARPQVLGAFSS
jgi:hypothetical protein